MARNKYPEETVQKILDISLRLFMQKGYDQTSIQDIVDALGMSKGAIYHHFKSKADILEHISDEFYCNNKWFQDIAEDPTLNGRDKIRRLFLYSLGEPRKLQIDRISLPMMQNSQMIALELQSIVDEVAPPLAQIIEEGNRDGSLHVEEPVEAAEAVLLLTNLWIGMTPGNRDRFGRRIRFIRQMTDRIGMSILDDEFVEIAMHYFDVVMQDRDPHHYEGNPPK